MDIDNSIKAPIPNNMIPNFLFVRVTMKTKPATNKPKDRNIRIGTAHTNIAVDVDNSIRWAAM